MFSDGFTDLRMNHQSGQGDDSFWPSFTDIMTVIVMIFLLAMVVVILRNTELIQQLRATMEAERAAAELVRTTSEEKEGLAVRLIDAEQQLSMPRLQMMRVTEQRNAARDSLSQRTETLNSLKRRFQASQADLQATRTELKQTSSQLSQAAEHRDVLANQLATTRSQLSQSQGSLAKLQKNYQQQNQQLQALTHDAEEASHRLAVLGGEYDELKTKYDKLVRPARTPRSKFVVEVRIKKIGKKTLIEMKNLADPVFKTVTEARLHQRLATLKQQHPKTLYVKIIFPENSNLSHTEAWGFTNTLHKKYDYYFQK